MRNSWNQGYYTDLEVYDGYTHELSPLIIDLNLTIAGYDCDSSIDFIESKGRKLRHFMSQDSKDSIESNLKKSQNYKKDSKNFTTQNTQDSKKDSIESNSQNMKDSQNLQDSIESNSKNSKNHNTQDSNNKDSKSPNHHQNKIGNIKSYKYLELGFGKGTSLNVHAASSLSSFLGNDFNPAQALYARTFGWASGANITIYDDSFAELESRLDKMIGQSAKECRKFDYIVLHGVFSWINKKNQKIILHIIKKYLKLGGIVYNSYNCLPGWACKMPARHIFALYNEFGYDSPLEKVSNCVTFFEKLLACEPMFSKLNPQNLDFLEQMKNLPNSQKSYIAHEYLNASWEIFYFSDMVKMLDSAKCAYLCSGKVIEHFEEFNITAQGVAFLNSVENKIFREQLKDYFTNRQFRVDLYARAARRISIFEAREKLLNTKFMLTRLASEFDFKADTARGTIDLMKDRYENLLNILESSAYSPKSLREIIALSKLSFPQAMSSIMLLIHQGMASVAQDVNEAILSQTRAYNAYLFSQQSMRLSSLYVASPVCACAIVMSESEQIFAKAYNELCARDSGFVRYLGDDDLVREFYELESYVLDCDFVESGGDFCVDSCLDSKVDSKDSSRDSSLDSNGDFIESSGDSKNSSDLDSKSYNADSNISRNLDSKDSNVDSIESRSDFSGDSKVDSRDSSGDSKDCIIFKPRFKITQENKQKLISYLTQYVFATFKPQDRKHVKDGVILQSDSENLEEISRLATQFIESKLPLYTALGIC